MKKDKKLTTLLKFFAGLLIVLGMTTWFPSLFTLIEGREVNVKYNDTQAPLFWVENLIIVDDTVVAYTVGSDSIITFNLDGTALYSIFFESSEGNGLPMAMDSNNVLIVPIPSANGYLLFRDGIYLGEVPANSSEHQAYREILSAQAENPKLPIDSFGNEYAIGAFGNSIIRTDTDGNKSTFASNPLKYQIFALPLPGLMYLGMGATIIVLLRKNEKKNRRDDIYLGPNGR
jgi:hypothetical protein